MPLMWPAYSVHGVVSQMLSRARVLRQPSAYEGVGVDGSVFRVTEGLLKLFGTERVIDTPLPESTMVGTSIGLALYGLKPVCEMWFLGFICLALHQLESHAARLCWRARRPAHANGAPRPLWRRGAGLRTPLRKP